MSCAEQIQSAGHIIQAVLSTDNVLQTWAEQQGVDWVNSVDELQEHVLLQPVDWLFSIVNPLILTDSLINQIRGGAFNYHDSPLPRYAGSYATSWALLERETEYAISWHCIESALNTGSIAVQWPVLIEEQDTAYLLNLKCHQAALQGFNKLLKALSYGTLVTYSQDFSQWSFYALSHRPEAGGYLCWEQPGEVLSALVRALDFGENNVNPLGCPKLLLKQDTVRISWLQRLDICSGEKPGTLIRVEEESWQVATGNEDVLIGGFFTLEGELLSAKVLAELSELKPGEQLLRLLPQQVQDAKNTLQKHALDESFWCQRLTDWQPTHLPFGLPHKIAEPRWVMSPWIPALPHDNQETAWKTLLQAFIIYLMRLTQQTVCQIGWCVRANDDLPSMASVVPMAIEAEFDKSWREVAAAVDNELDLLAQHGTYSRDLFSRFPVLSAIPELKTRHPWPIAVSVVQDNRLCAQERSGELLTFQINTQGNFRWVYDENRLDATVIRRMSEHLQQILSSARTDETTPIRQFNLLSETERILLLKTWNATESSYPDDLCIHQLFEQQTEKTPEAAALVYENQTLSYAELNARANGLAHQLMQEGVCPGEHVALLLARSVALVVAQLAVLKAGAVYVPIDPSVPEERKNWLIKDCAARLLIIDMREDIPANLTVPLLRLLDEEKTNRGQDCRNPDLKGSNTELAYIMYTSGSTGTPKGVLVPHRAVIRLVINNDYAQIKPDDHVAFMSNPAFDASTFEVWAPLLNGGALVIIDHHTLLTPAVLILALQAHRVGVMWLTVGLFNQLAAELSLILPQIKLLIIGGDALDPHVIREVLSTNPPQQLVNGYGPTEGTTFTTTYCIQAVAQETTNIPIGRPIANTRVYLLDDNGQLVPLGATGEIYVGGDGVALGYLNQPELTAERFLIDPFSEKPGARMYRTGDLARYRPDGNLEFLGRNDQQVKIRGFRIELGEIEVRLMEYPAVRESVVLALGEGADKRLVAYVVATATEDLVNRLRTHLSTQLPDYMMPAAFVRLDTLPLTSNGKLDRKALPEPDSEAFARQRYEAPQGDIETSLAGIWSEVLGIDRISRHDNFFALGGHSLIAVRVINRIMTVFSVELPLIVLFNSPSLVALALEIQIWFDKRDGVALSAIIPLSKKEILPLSLAQQRLWFLAQLEGVSETYHIPIELHLHGKLNKEALQKALNTVFARHEALRMIFVSVEGQPQIRLLEKESGLPLMQHDLRGHPAMDTALEQLCADIVSAPFEFSKGPLVRAALIQLTDDEYQFLLIQHHIVSDGWSVDILICELNTLYAAFLNGQSNPLPPLLIQYPDYAAWQREWLSAERIQVQSDYWRTMLADPPVLLDLPIDKTRPLEQSFSGNALPISLNPEFVCALKHLSQQQGVTLFMTLLSAWAVVLSCLSGQDDVIIGTPSAGRSRQEVEPLVGFFVNTLALRVKAFGELTIAELLEQTRQTVLTAQMHQDLPFEQVVEIVHPPRRLAHTPLFQVMFSWQNNEQTDWLLPGLTVTPTNLSFNVAKFDLGLELYEKEGGIEGVLNYATALFDQSSIERHVNYFQAVLQAMIADPQQKVGGIDILDSTERQLLLEDWNATEVLYPETLCLHQLFEQQVEKTPDAVALIYEDQMLCYAELNARANQLAHQLLMLGVVPDQLVAICVSRSPAMVVGVLAILKSGGAYVPLDPIYSGERLATILIETSPNIVLADNIGQVALGKAGLTGRIVLDPNLQFDQPDYNPKIITLTSHHLAYVIYTSGSTGTPKGVMVEHRGVCNYLWGMDNYLTKKPFDSMISSSLAFDFTVTSLYLPLLWGGKIHLLHSGEEMAEFIPVLLSMKPGTLVKITPSHLLVAGQELKATGLTCPGHCFVVGGEILPGSTVALWQSLSPDSLIINEYGPTETVVACTVLNPSLLNPSVVNVPIGRPIANMRIYLLDTYGKIVPIGSVGEIYIGGIAVSRGYLNQPELTAERFLIDPFSNEPDAHMYRTGDLARYLPDGNLEFLTRNDQQVKIRGFRIEPAEIEARLAEHPAVRGSAVLALGDGQEKRLVAYVVADAEEKLANSLWEHLRAWLPEYMVPAEFVRLDNFPLTPNGKLDRRALPLPDEKAFVRQDYEAPQGEAETILAAIWCDLLGIRKISRHDNFFALGGHSLLAVRMIERLRQLEMVLEVRDLFQNPVLSDLTKTLGRNSVVAVPANMITPDTTTLTPTMLPLINLTQADIDYIIGQVPGGMGNIQDIYALSPLQDGILFHHLLESEGDPYLLFRQMIFENQTILEQYLAAVQQVVDRHDILRTAFFWQGLSVPAQVVLRKAALSITNLKLDPEKGPISEQLSQRFDPHHYRLNLSEAPLLQFMIAPEVDGCWHLLELHHHLIGDHITLEAIHHEICAYLAEQEKTLPVSVPFRHLVAQAQMGVGQEAHTRFFSEMLAEVEEPTLPFELAEVHQDGLQVTEYHQMLVPELSIRLRRQAQQLGVSLATLCHVAWAQVLSRTSGQEKVVFGTVLLGRMTVGAGMDSGLGPFINTLPLRLDIGNMSVRDSVQRAHIQLAELLAHEHASLALAQRCSNVDNTMPLFSALLNYRHNDAAVLLDKQISGIEFVGEKERTNYPLVLSVEDFGELLGLTVQIIQPLEPERVCNYMQQALESLVDALEYTPDRPIRSLSILPEAERTLLLTTWNKTEARYPEKLCIHQLFEQQAAKTPDAIALVYEGQILSYAELNTRANRLAHQLIALGVAPDQRVVICVSRSPEMVVGILAILKAGGAYVPLDPTYPNERLTQILTDSGPVIVLVDETGQTAFGDKVLTVQKVLNLNTVFEQPECNPQVVTLTSRHLAYVIYTSGSTGLPKGVMNEHRGVVNRLQWALEEYQLTKHDRVLQKTPFSFDVSVWEFFLPLLAGAQLIIARPDGHKDPAYLLAEIESQGITTIHFVPSMLQNFLHYTPVDRCQSLRRILCSGEALAYSLQQQCMEHFPHSELHNLYGPTEAAIDVTFWHCHSDQYPGRVPIGRPIANTQLYILDKDYQPVPVGVVSELYIGGIAVARGYLNQPERTEEFFLPDPFSEASEARMYRTGDLARYLPDGSLEFLGRNDQQVKIRGFRIELGEIETRLAEHPAVRGSAVLALGDGQEKRLVAYMVADAEEGLINSLRTYLISVLPDYMVPAAFVRLDVLPLTPNGKLDRRALPVPGEDDFARQIYAAPQGEAEIILASVWRELLGIEKISRHDNFFALGGHSLLAIRMMEHLRRRELKLVVRNLFQMPRLSDLAQTLGQCHAIQIPANVITSDTTSLTPAMLPLIDLTQTDINHIIGQLPGGVRNIQDIYALSPLQDGMLFHHLLASDRDPYLMVTQIAFAERALLDRYLVAVQQVINRHDILRTAFFWQGLTVPAQVVLRQVTLSVTELTLDFTKGSVSEQLAQRFNFNHYRINLNEAPLLRFVAAQERDGRWIVLQLLHHLIDDNTALKMMYREIHAHLMGQEVHLPAPFPFRNLVAQTRLNINQESHTRFFTEMLADVKEPTLPFGLSEVHRDGSQVTGAQRMLPSALNSRLRRQAQKLGVSLAALCHLAWAQVLSRTGGQEKVVFGTVLFGRMTIGGGTNSGMGLFINTLPLRLDMDETPVQESAQNTHTRLAGLLMHEHASLVLAQGCSGVNSGSPLFSALLNYRHHDLMETPVDMLDGIEFLGGQERTNYPLVLSVDDSDESLELKVEVVQPFEPSRICDYMQQVLESLVGALENTPNMPIRALEILPEAERTLLLTTWNATGASYPETLCIHQLFEQRVEKTPDAIALVYENQSLSYAELNAQANRVAHQLIQLGVEPDQRVAMCVSRSLAMVIGVLAILKAGGVYVPLDPAYPDERLAYMLEDAAPVAVLTQTEWIDRLASTVPIVLLDAQAEFWMPYSTNNPEPRVLGLTSHNLAYVIYTSGSTGRPKGVMNSHKALCNRLLWFVQNIATMPLVGALKTSISFVDSVTEMLGVLLAGGKLVVFNDHEMKNLDRFCNSLYRFSVNYLVVVPSLLKHLIQGDSYKLKSIRTLVCSGERLSPELARQVVTDYPWLRLLNFYGSSEINGDATWYEYPAQAEIAEASVIGRPIANTQIYLLDPIGRPVPLGVVGEIYIAGAGVACGYLNRPELTAKHFLHDPYSNKQDAHMFRTGDLARYRSDGNLEFLGRNDQQVKIRGFRIEPEEIEVRLMEHPAVRGSVVLALHDGTEKRLVAYVMADAEKELVNSLRIHLNSVLPDYMVPAAFVRLDSFPLTANGKLDRQALPAPDSNAFSRQHYEAPQGATEILLAAIWYQLLGIEQISRHDNFFALGGHSLSAVRMMNFAASQGLSFTLNTLFQFPVLNELAAKIALEPLLQPQSSAIPVRPGGAGVPLFFVPSGMGDYSYVFGLSQYISLGYPIYALPWPSINEEPMSTIEELAVRMVTLMKVIQPTGPYRIVGYSSGGVLAYAIAQQLLNAHEQVNFLGLIDTSAPHYLGKEATQSKYRFLFELARQLGGERPEEISELYQSIEVLNLVQFIELAQELALYPANLRADVIAKRWEQITHYAQIVKDYEPTALTIALHQFYAIEPDSIIFSVMEKTSESVNTDPSLGWVHIMPDALLQLIAVSGNHFSMIENHKHKIALAEALNRKLLINSDIEPMRY
ncbi:non-ribosomal peptide synthetase [Xenorhabdus doucetiae]|uniref:non-ribosomal peptide synthetase n=1 Tax=Xenorhabdus doucetiae TaxID=351671 RepID=UPI002B4016EC|nr:MULTISPECIES: non-ribosomal peptide synthetase [unclassified Xenorhabdus]